MLRPSNRAWLKAVPYVLQRYFSFCVYGKLNLKMSTSKRRLDWMSPSSNNARFYIGNSVPLPSAPFPLSCRYLSLFQWLLLWIVKFIFFFFLRSFLHLLPWIQGVLLLEYLLLGASFLVVSCICCTVPQWCPFLGSWVAIWSLVVSPFRCANSEWWCGSSADATCQSKWMGKKYFCYFEMPDWFHIQLALLIYPPFPPPPFFFLYTAPISQTVIVSAAPSQARAFERKKPTKQTQFGFFPALTSLAAHHFHSECASAVIRHMLSVGFSSHPCSLNIAEVPFSL